MGRDMKGEAMDRLSLAIAILTGLALLTGCDNPFKSDERGTAPAPALQTNAVSNTTVIRVQVGRDFYYAADDGRITQRITEEEAADLVAAGAEVEDPAEAASAE
jgi:uncharacterized lipoprotein YajG